MNELWWVGLIPGAVLLLWGALKIAYDKGKQAICPGHQWATVQQRCVHCGREESYLASERRPVPAQEQPKRGE